MKLATVCIVLLLFAGMIFAEAPSDRIENHRFRVALLPETGGWSPGITAWSPVIPRGTVFDFTAPDGPDAGGNFWKSDGYLGAAGPVLESCQGRSPGQTQCLACPPQDFRLTRTILLANSVEDITVALVDGSLVCTVKVLYTATDFEAYDGTYVIQDNGSHGSDCDHGVLIVGYHEGSGDPGYLDGDYWISQSSWSTSWGDAGFFYIAYGAANIGTEATQFTEWEDSLETQNAILLHENESGGYGTCFSPANIIYICQELTPPAGAQAVVLPWHMKKEKLVCNWASSG